MTKLTLSADHQMVKRAKKIAARQNTSVSALFARFVLAASGPADAPPAIGPISLKATGIIPPRRGKSDQRILEDALLEKYGF